MYDNYITFITDDGFINVFGKLDITYKIKRTGIMHKTYTLYALSNVDKCKYKFYTSKNKQMLEQIRNFLYSSAAERCRYYRYKIES